MPPPPPDPAWTLLTIAAVERETGIGKDTLRAWERRYGFPAPARTPQGDRAFTWSQVERLRRVHRLIAAGYRPGALMRLSSEELEALARQEAGRGADPEAAALAPSAPPTSSLLSLDHALALVRHGGSPAVRQWLMQSIAGTGLAQFVLEGMAPFLVEVGDAWMHARLQVFEEHLLSEAIATVLRHALVPLQASVGSSRPRVLLTTLPGEEHALGILMAEVMLTLGGAACLSLGPSTPVGDLALAVQAQPVDVVAVSFTTRMTAVRRHAALADLRSRLPDAVEIWVGGAGAARERGREMPGWTSMDLRDIEPAVARWRPGGAPETAEADPGTTNARS